MNQNSMVSGHAQMPTNEILSDLSEPSSPDSTIYDSEILGSAVNDDVTNQLAASGPIGVAAAAAVLSTRKRKLHPHHFETNPARRKRQQTRLLRKLRHTIEEYSTRVGQQAVVLCCTPNVNHSMMMYKIRNNKPQILSDLESALLEHTPPSQAENSALHELPSLVIDGIPTPVDKMTQAQLRNFIPEMLKYSTGRSKPGWGRIECRPIWWPSDLPWANVRSDVRTDEEKKRVPWTEALRQIVKNCYMHHGRHDLLQVFKEEPQSGVTVQHQQQYAGTMMQTINNPDGSVSIIQIDTPSQMVTLPDGTQATLVHAIHDNNGVPQLTSEQEIQISQSFTDTSNMVAVSAATQEVASQQAALGALQASLNSSGHIILTGADASQLSGIMTVLPVSMYQTVQAVQPISTNIPMNSIPVNNIPVNNLPVNFQLAQSSSQPIEVSMASVSSDVTMAINQHLQGGGEGQVLGVAEGDGGVSVEEVGMGIGVKDETGAQGEGEEGSPQENGDSSEMHMLE
ncbi:P3A2-like protein [Mya arenaria]|uniref:P3A2-like protein n=1 Tax=Mya arenaria TaxID=6604 RepID=A0ABY7FXY2_MYAAR|nr:P3A2-like protein [Mya arenaria]